MALRLASEGEDLAVAHEINVTPFIDVMLVLLIIFMVAAPLATVDVKVDLPMSNAKPAPKPESPVFLTIESSGQLSVNDRPVPVEGLAASVLEASKSNREERIYLRADKTVSYEQVMEAMNVLRSTGYLRVSLMGAEGATR